MSIKTLHFTNYWHTESGRIATFYREILNAAGHLCRQIRMVVPAERDGVEHCGAFGKIYHIKGRSSRLSPGYRLLMPQKYLPPCGPLRQILATERPDLVECCDRYTLNYLAGRDGAAGGAQREGRTCSARPVPDGAGSARVWRTWLGRWTRTQLT